MYTPDFLMLLKKIEERFSIYILVKNKLLEMQGLGYKNREFPPVRVHDVIDLDSIDYDDAKTTTSNFGFVQTISD